VIHFLKEEQNVYSKNKQIKQTDIK